ncbi:Uu.00g082040.m01.CDS01 [Anthostomella pinea]|uniref:Uu.00g082040.m01.CDS01 n=1 Tax=Anthostomella pinea TaxID=933095 RepID=A0AAI8VLD6_9PEZI|nr:Uu.00g082040.m01.CDS01 [Anthostomella pinea]
MDTTFSDDEKRFVLGEMIKVSTIDVTTLIDFIRAHQIEPNWMSMQLPGGRNMNQCLGAVDNMFQVRFPPPNLIRFKRKSLSDLVDQPAKRQAMMAPVESPLAPARVIQPRPPPPPPNGYRPAPIVITGSSPVTTTTTTSASTTGKKRGRPSKADKEAQAQARAAYSRPTPITPAPLPLAPIVQQREYATSPGYEIASSLADQNSRMRSRPGPVDSPRQTSGPFPLASPASTTGTPRALPEPLEQVERANLSPRDQQASAPLDSRSPTLHAYIQHQEPSPRAHAHPQPRQQLPVPIQPSPRPLQPYDQYRGPDPIFPDRDRNRSMPDPISRNSPPSPVVNRG